MTAHTDHPLRHWDRTCPACLEKNAAPLIEASTDTAQLPQAIYICLVPSEHMLDQPGSWRIRKWDTEPFPEATHVAALSQPPSQEAHENLQKDLESVIKLRGERIAQLEADLKRVGHLKAWKAHTEQLEALLRRCAIALPILRTMLGVTHLQHGEGTADDLLADVTAALAEPAPNAAPHQELPAVNSASRQASPDRELPETVSQGSAEPVRDSAKYPDAVAAPEEAPKPEEPVEAALFRGEGYVNGPSALYVAARSLLAACEMEAHNEAIFTGKWKKGSKAWNGDFVAKQKADAMDSLKAAIEASARDDSQDGQPK